MMNYQDKRETEQGTERETPVLRLGTVTARSGYTYQIRFDGEDAATSKYHKGNNTHSYAVGARVVCARVGGGYVVLCSIS